MPFAYYERLSKRDQAIYRLSDEVRALRVYRPGELSPLVKQVRVALPGAEVERVALALVPLLRELTERLEVPPVSLAVLETRPRWPGAELHGLYTRPEDEPPLILVWMRTAVNRRPVAFKTFLRTVLHELCHHLDMELLGLPVSFHTQGFFMRENSLFHQLVPGSARKPKPAGLQQPGAAQGEAVSPDPQPR